MNKTRWLANFVFLFSHTFPLDMLIVNALNHKLEGFGSISLAVEGKEVSLVGDLEELPP